MGNRSIDLLLKNVLDILVEIGMRQMDQYENYFEKAMLTDTVAYYSRKALNWFLEDSCPEYMLKAEECLRQEDRVSYYLHFSSEAKLLEVACKELRNSRLFLKPLEVVLKTGNRMNDGTFRGGAKAFKLDTLLKLSDVKGADGKTTLLHFVVLEIIRTEGKRAARRLRERSITSVAKTKDLLEDTPENHFSLGFDVVSNLSNELENVKKAAVVEGDMLTTTATKLGVSLKQSLKLLNNELRELEGECEFRKTLANFI